MAKLHEEEVIHLAASPSLLQSNLTYDDESKKLYYVHKNHVEAVATLSFIVSPANEESLQRMGNIETDTPFSLRSCNFVNKGVNVLTITSAQGIQFVDPKSNMVFFTHPSPNGKRLVHDTHSC
jgi:hypothetical protein